MGNDKKTTSFTGVESLDQDLLDAVSGVVNTENKIRMNDQDQYVDRVTANLPNSEMISEDADYEPADSMGKNRGAHRLNTPKPKRRTVADDDRDRAEHRKRQAEYRKEIATKGESPSAARARRDKERMRKFQQQQAAKAKKESFGELTDEDVDNLLEMFIHEGGLDNVNKKALKKNFKDRNDKDIDNDGDVDDSDEYLHNRRKKIASKVKEGKNGKKDPVVINPTVESVDWEEAQYWDEETVADFLKRGGKITKLKPRVARGATKKQTMKVRGGRPGAKELARKAEKKVHGEEVEKFDIKAFVKGLKEGVVEWGTDEGANRYKDMTPGQTPGTNNVQGFGSDKPELEEAGARDHFRQFQKKFKTMPKIDTKEYPDIRGLEGPFRFKNGAILYYDPKEGKYYDNKKDMYVEKLPEGWEIE